MKTLYVVPIEPIETRYTAEWYNFIPKSLKEFADQKSKDIRIEVIPGKEIEMTTTPGAFLDFGGTNVYKCSQMQVIAEKFNKGLIKSGDVFLYTDAWNPTIIQLKYMSELLNIPIKIVGLWHAGSYDPSDFLGRLVGNKPWVRHAEMSLFNCIDVNCFATEFHIELFCKELLFGNDYDITKKSYQLIKNKLRTDKKILRTGWPMLYMEKLLNPYKNMKKRDLILFPHRIAPEKQVEIFRDLKEQLPQYEFIVCQDQKLSKKEYHTLLGQAKIVFSANLQETLGISSALEGPLSNALPMIPNRLSYVEIFEHNQEFLYPSKWTIDFNSYMMHRESLKNKIIFMMNNYEALLSFNNDYIKNHYQYYFDAEILYENII